MSREEGSYDADEATMMSQVPDPGLDALREELSVENLRGMQEVLRRCRIEHIVPGSALEGVNFPGLIKNLRGIGKIEIGDVKVYALLTRHNAFLLSNLLAEQLHDLIRGFMDLSLADRATLLDGERRRYLFKVPSSQLERLRTIANRNSLITNAAFRFVNLEQFRRLLADFSPVGVVFDVARFADSVRAVSNLYEDQHGNALHHVVAGEVETIYFLYVSPRTRVPHSIPLVRGTTRLALVRDV